MIRRCGRAAASGMESAKALYSLREAMMSYNKRVTVLRRGCEWFKRTYKRENKR
jgi:hypothetical protein